MIYNILFIAHDTYTLGGAALSLLNMISSLGDNIRPVVLLHDEGQVADKLKEKGIEYIIYPYYMPKRTYTNKYYYRYFLNLLFYNYKKYKNDINNICKLLNNRKIDIVHSNSSIVTIGFGLAKKLKAKHIWHLREFLSLDFNIKIFGGLRLLKHWINKSDATICISNSIKNFWINNKSHAQTYIIGDAVRSKDDAIYIKAKNKYILFCSAYISENKGALVSVEAFFLSGLHLDGYHLKMVGRMDSNILQIINNISDKYNSRGSIEFIDFTENTKDLYANASAFIMASKCEALGRVTIEAMFYGCPVIARATGGTLDLIRHNETGYLFNTTEECASLLKEIVIKDNETIIRKAQAFVSKEYSEENYGSKIIKVYQSVLETHLS